jgi:pimeloyl-ACP methyl ester carboxylesterase
LTRIGWENGMDAVASGIRLLTGTLLVLFAGQAYAQSSLAQEVTFLSGKVELRGTVLLPEGRGPFPAIVFLHGSGCSTRGDMRPIADSFVERGYAGLVFDKRGCGASKGNWSAASLLDLAADAEAALRFIVARPDIDQTRVGLWGISQSGWVAPIAATRSDLARFLIVVTGGGASPREVETFGHGQQLRHRGTSIEANPAAGKLLDAYFGYLETGKERAALLQLIDSAKQQSWYEALRLDGVLPSEKSRPAWAWVATYDPLPDIQKIMIPTLVLFGAQDGLLPVAVSVQRWTAGLQQAKAHGSQVVTFPEAGHGITLGGHHGPGGPRQYAPGFIPTVAAWLETVTLAPHGT